MNNAVAAAQLRAAANLAERLTADGSKVLTYYHNGRRPVLIVDQPPVGMQGSLVRRAPTFLGRERTLAAPIDGVQVQWSVADELGKDVAHGH